MRTSKAWGDYAKKEQCLVRLGDEDMCPAVFKSRQMARRYVRQFLPSLQKFVTVKCVVIRCI